MIRWRVHRDDDRMFVGGRLLERIELAVQQIGLHEMAGAIADAIGTFLGRAPERRHVESRAGDVRHTLADISKAEKLLGYKPAVDFAEGMHRTCEYFVKRFS